MTGAIKVDRRQDEDGRPHFTYFDHGTQLSFVWSGDFREPIQVCHGGYGEPVVDNIGSTDFFAPREGVVLPQAWLLAFQMTCDEYIKARKMISEADLNEDVQ